MQAGVARHHRRVAVDVGVRAALDDDDVDALGARPVDDLALDADREGARGRVPLTDGIELERGQARRDVGALRVAGDVVDDGTAGRRSAGEGERGDDGADGRRRSATGTTGGRKNRHLSSLTGVRVYPSR